MSRAGSPRGGIPTAATEPCFPVRWEQLGSHITFVPLEPDQWYEINGFRVKAKLQPHSGDSYGYRFEQGGKAVVYSTDAEQKLASEVEAEAMIDFYRGADLVIFDAMYSLADMITIKEDWGHPVTPEGLTCVCRRRSSTIACFIMNRRSMMTCSTPCSSRPGIMKRSCVKDTH
jgi:hypothetical protein